jgi:hypothetical protein
LRPRPVLSRPCGRRPRQRSPGWPGWSPARK